MKAKNMLKAAGGLPGLVEKVGSGEVEIYIADVPLGAMDTVVSLGLVLWHHVFGGASLLFGFYLDGVSPGCVRCSCAAHVLELGVAVIGTVFHCQRQQNLFLNS